MASSGQCVRPRSGSLSRAASPLRLANLNSEFQRLQDLAYAEFPDFTRISYDFRDIKDACKALFAQNKQLFGKVLQLVASSKGTGNELVNLKLKAENMDLSEKMRTYSELIVKLSNENDYYAKHIHNLLAQLQILKGDKRAGPHLKATELHEQLLIKEEELRNLQDQLHRHDRPPLDSKLSYAKLVTLQDKLNAELAEKELQRHSQQDFLSHMHTQAKAIEKLMEEVTDSQPALKLIEQLKREKLELMQEVEMMRRQAGKAGSSRRAVEMTQKQRAAMEEVNDFLALGEVQRAAEAWRKMDYMDLPDESRERTVMMLREVLKLRDSALSRLRSATDSANLSDLLLEKDAEIDILKNTLLAGSDSSTNTAFLQRQVKALTEELRQKEEEMRDITEENAGSSTSAPMLQLALKQKDQEIEVLLDELVKLREAQEPGETLLTALNEKNAKIMRLETELGLFRGSSDALNTNIETILSDFALKSGSKVTEDQLAHTTQTIQKLALKSLSEQLISEAESKAKALSDSQKTQFDAKLKSLEAALSSLRAVLEEERQAHAAILSQQSSTPREPETRELQGKLEAERRNNADLTRKLAQMAEEIDRAHAMKESPRSAGRVKDDQIQRIKDLQTQVNSLQEEVLDAEFKQKQAEIQAENLETDKEKVIQTLKTEIEMLTAKAQEADKKLIDETESLRKREKEAKMRCESIGEELEDVKLERGRLYVQLESAFNELKAAKEALEEAQTLHSKELVDKEDVIEDLSRQVQAVTSELRREDPEEAERQAAVQLFAQVRGRMEDFCGKAAFEGVEMEGNPGDIVSALCDILAKTKGNEGKMQEIEGKNAQLQREIEDLRQAARTPLLNESSSSFKDVKSEIRPRRLLTDSQRSRKEASKLESSFRAEYQALEEEKQGLEQDLAHVKEELNYTQSQFKRCVVDFETLETGWKQALAKLRDQVKARFDLEKQPIVLLDPYVNPQAFLETLNAEFVDLNKRKAAEKDKIAKAFADLQEGRQAWSDREAELRSALQAASQEKVSLELTVQSLQSQANILRQEVEMSKETAARLEMQVAILQEKPGEEAVIEAYEKGKSDARRLERSELDLENKKLQSLLKEYKDSLEDIKRKWKDTQERLSTSSRLNSDLTTQLQTLTHELESEHEAKIRLGTDLQSKSDFFERVLADVEHTKQFYHK